MISSTGLVGDVCHLNLHKTFCIPHGGGGPGFAPILVKEDLKKYLPKNIKNQIYGSYDKNGPIDSIGDYINGAPLSSASLLVIPYLYIKSFGSRGLKKSSI